MSESEGVAIAVVQAHLAALRQDVAEMSQEMTRTRGRLHDLEGIASMLVNQEKERNRDTRRQQRRTEVRLQALTVVIAVMALAEPLLYHLAVGG